MSLSRIRAAHPISRRNRSLLLASVFGGAMVIAAPAAAQTVISTDTTDTTIRTITGTQTITVNENVTLTVNGQTRAISWTATTPSTATDGPVIDNRGTIRAGAAGARVVDTVGSTASRTITIYNRANAVMTSDEDAIRIFNSGTNTTAGSTIRIDNAGQITSTIGDGIDLASVSAATLLFDNAATGVVDAGANGLIIGSATIHNYGRISGDNYAIYSTSTLAAGARTIWLHAGSVTNGGNADGNAIYLTGGVNIINFEVGASINGAIRGGASGPGRSDTLNLSGTGSGIVPVVANFEGLNVQSGTWTLPQTFVINAPDGGGAASPAVISSGATLRFGNGGTLGSINGAITNNGALIYNRSDVYAQAAAQTIAGNGTLEIVSGTYAFGNANTYSGVTTVTAGTLRADAVNSFSAASAITLGSAGTLNLNGFSQTVANVAGSGDILLGNTGATLTLGANNADSILTGEISGTGNLVKTGTGTLQLTGANSFAGTTTVSNGNLIVEGSLTGGVALNAGTLSGAGTIAGAVATAAGTTIAPGGAGVAGRLNTGSLTLDAGTVLAFDLGAPGNANAALSDRIVVTGDLTLDGTLNVNNVGSFGMGVYRLIDYTGNLTDNGLAVGTMPAGTDMGLVSVQTVVGQQVNLVYGDAGALVPAVQFWDGAGATGDATITGGAGSWVNGVTNWTRADGVINDAWGEQFAVFGVTGGTVTVDDAVRFGGMQFTVNGYEIAAGTGSLEAIETVTAMRVDSGISATVSAAIGGTGGLTKLDTGTLTLTGANSYTGGTVVNGGRLRLAGAGALPGSVTVASGAVVEVATAQSASTIAGEGSIELGALLTVGAGNADSSFAGTLSGGGALAKAGTGTLILSGANDYSGGTTLTAGTLRLAAGGKLGTGDLAMTTGTTLDLAGIATQVGTFSGAGAITLGTDGSLTVNETANTSFGGAITGTRGAFVKNGTGTLILTGANTFTGGTTINAGTLALTSSTSLGNSGAVRIEAAGTLSLGSNKTIGGLNGTGSLLLGANTLTVSTANVHDFAGTASGSGGITKASSGTFTLSGVNSYTGLTTASAGILLINGAVAGDASVLSGATLGGTGTIAGTVTVGNGGNLTGRTAGTAGVLTMGNLVLTSGSSLIYDLGAPSIAAASDRINVLGNVTLAGALNITDIGQFGTGVYRLIEYGGTLTNDGIAFGTLPSGVAVAQLDLQTSVANQVNLIVSGPLPDIQFWDGAGPGNDGVVQGGAGSWTNSAYNWTEANGAGNNRWGAKFAVFQGAGGTVSVDDAISFTGMQFTDNGYVLAAGTGSLQTTTIEGNIRVDSGVTARIDANITGTGGLTKLDTGTLILGGQNSYTGLTTVSGGTLRIAATGALGATSAVSVESGATLDVAAAQAIGGLSGAGAVALNADLSIGGGNAASTFSGNFSGAGLLTKAGTGIFTLSGAQTHSGGTVIDGGTIRLAGATVLGTGAVTMATGTTLDLAGNTLSVNRLAGLGTVTLGTGGALTVAEAAADGSYGGVISGAGSLTKTGAGTLTLTGANTFTGGTRIDGGTLALTASNSLANAGDVAIGAAGTLSIATSKTIGALSGQGNVLLGTSTLTVGSGGGSGSFAGVVSGTGGLTKTGTGTLTLAGANTYTGTTTISGGTLGLAATGSIASGVNITGATGVLDLSTAGDKTIAGLRGIAGSQVTLGTGTLTIAGTATETWAGTIGGAGNVVKAGTNTLTFSGANSYTGTTTLSGGILRAGAANAFSTGALNITDGRFDLAGFDQNIGSLSGVGTVTLGSGTLTAGGNNATTSYGGVISGTGNLVKAGSGTLTLTGNNTYSGFTRVDAGKLVVNGTLASTMSVAAGGRLGGNSSFASLDVAGTLTPGNSVGVIQTTGNVTFRAGSVYEVETNSTIGSDLVAAGGNVLIEGGTVRVTPLGQGYNPQTTYQIVSAGGTLTGRFDGVTSDLAFLAPTLAYTGNAVNLVLQRVDIAFDTVAITPNQAEVARAVQAAGSGTVFSQVLGQDTAGARRAFNELSGEIYAGMPALAAYQARQNRDATLDRLAEPVAGGVWLQYATSSADVDADSGRAALNRQASGVRGGLDAELFGVRVGAMAGHTTSDVDAGTLASKASLTGTHVGAYAGYGLGPIKLRAGAILDSITAKIYRSVSIGGFGDQPRGQGQISTIQGFGEIAYSFAFGGFSLEPFAGASLTRVKAARITETGGLAALEVAKAEDSVFGARAGLRFSGALPIFTDSKLRLTGALAVQSQDLDKIALRSARLLSTGQAFTIEGNRPANTSGSVDVGVALDAMGGTLSVRYVGEYSRNMKDHGVRAGVAWQF